MKKIGRNDPCHCGSKKKYKKCCDGFIKKISDLPRSVQAGLDKEISKMSEIHKANEVIRQKQQGLGKPIIQAKIGDHQIVAVGNTMYSSKTWKVPADFLSHYIGDVLAKEWGIEELTKTFEQRHPIMQWYENFVNYQKSLIKGDGEIYSAPSTGAVLCYLGLAYNLYLVEHNIGSENIGVKRLIERLKNKDQFQGAYYELIIMNCLIRAGFDLSLINEVVKGPKRCEFDAICKKSGEKYTVEAKMKGVAGLLGKHSKDGSINPDPISSMGSHLDEALQKSASGKRIIFIGLNTDSEVEKRQDNEPPSWLENAAIKLEEKEKSLADQQSAYVFVTNIPYHLNLDSVEGGIVVFSHGLGINDFAKPGIYALSEKYRRKQKHIDLYEIGEAFKNYPNIPQTFDGSIPCYAFNKELQRTLIGEKYFFEDVGDGGITGVVTCAAVSKTEKIVYFTVYTDDQKSTILTRGMSEDELRDYEEYGDSFFGSSKQSATKKIDGPYELFEWFYEVYKKSTKEKLLEFLQTHPSIGDFQKMDQEDLAILYCELRVADAVRKNKVD